MKGVFKTTTNKILKNPVMQVDRKINMLKALLYAKGLFYAGTWRQLDKTEARKVNIEIIRIYRTMSGYNKPHLRGLVIMLLLKNL